MSERKKYYLMQYPSNWGMGSNVDIRLVEEQDLRLLIRLELEKRRLGEQHYDDRYTGTWSDEKLPETDDMEVLIDDVIRKRMSKCSTYSHITDLIELPEDVPIVVRTEHMENRIFRIMNQFSCGHDVIVGDATFTRYQIDMRCHETIGNLVQGVCYEFTAFDFKRVLMNFLMSSMSSFTFMLNANRNKLVHYVRKLPKEERPHPYTGAYADTIDPTIFKDEYDRNSAIEALRLNERIKNYPPMKDEYRTHLYQVDCQNELFCEVIDDINDEEAPTDYTTLLYDDVRMAREYFGVIYHQHEQDSHFFYDELFRKGDDVRWCTADLTQSVSSMESFNGIEPILTLASVFTFD